MAILLINLWNLW